MTESQAKEYKQECIQKKKSQKTGQDSKTYKLRREIEKIEKEKEKARLSRDLALAATQQAKQQTAAVRQQKANLEAEIADLRQEADSYPTDLQEHLGALSAAATKYHYAAADANGPLIEFLQKIKVNQKQPDGSTVKRTVYDVWQEYRQKQEQKLAAQAEQARQGAADAQRRLPTFQSTSVQQGDFYAKNF
ncbi:MAG: hypothetical protein HFJ41_09475, partial [Clostridia bacterium]|nr:hypothetical protein [Clostridia bacterium]